MKPTPAQRWTRFQSLYREFPECDLAVDLSRLDFDDDFLRRMAKPMTEALESMRLLEAGHEANPDEHRKVGHYWLRQPSLAPTPELRAAISETLDDLKKFAASVHAGDIRGKDGPFEHVLVIGIGGSALGPQFVARALGHPLTDKLRIHFFDNTDPDGMDRTLAPLLPQLGRALVVVISKSGTTPETRNGLLEAAEAFRRAGVPFAPQAVAITQFDPQKSELYGRALEEQWRAAFPMWDWVGGRTSETSVVGLLPAALQGFDVDDFLAGARDCDALTRSPEPIHNPAALLALGWYHAGNGRGDRDMVILPYKDRLELFSRYLQQLIMESLGKELDLSGCIVHQGIAVYGNKGSTDQHAYVQQLRDGLHNFFVVFIQVLRGRVGESIQVGPEVTSADYLNGLLLGTRAALHEKGRESITLTIPEVTPRTVGMLIALFERAVGLYAFLVRINAYHQPGVEAGKTAAASVLDLQGSILRALRAEPGRPFTAGQLSVATGHDDPETIFKVCQHLAANSSGVIRSGTGCDATFNV